MVHKQCYIIVIKINDFFSDYSTFMSVHFPGFCVFSLLMTCCVGGICHSPVEGGRELQALGSSSQKILKAAFLVCDSGKAKLAIPLLLAKKRQEKDAVRHWAWGYLDNA